MIKIELKLSPSLSLKLKSFALNDLFVSSSIVKFTSLALGRVFTLIVKLCSTVCVPSVTLRLILCSPPLLPFGVPTKIGVETNF